MRWRGAWPPRKASKGDRCVPSVRWSRVPPLNTGDAHHRSCATLPRAVSLPNPCGAGLDACAHPDVVSVPHPNWDQRPGMAGSADGSSRSEIPAAGQLLRLDRGLRTGSEAHGGAIENALGGVVEWIRAAVEPDSRKLVRALSHGLLLDRVPVGMGDRCGVPRGGFSEAVNAAFGTAWDAQLFQRRRDALLRRP